MIKELQGGSKMGEIIIPHAVERKPNHLYYVDGQGNVCEAEMRRSGRKKKKEKES